MGRPVVKILVLTFYYAPDLSAGSFRATALVRSLLDAVPPGSSIDVVTTRPNRYGSFDTDAVPLERDGSVTVHRVALPPHRSGMRDQARAFISFALGAARLVRGAEYDVVFATSSRLMTAALGAWIASRVRARLYLDLRDIFVDTIKDVMPGHVVGVAKPVFSAIERWTVSKAERVNLVSRGFAGYFSERYPRQHFSYFTNGVDAEFMTPVLGSLDAASATAPVTVLYAGNIGEGQGLHAILPRLARRMDGRARFRVIGDGGRRSALADALRQAGAANVTLLDPVARGDLIAAYREADVLFLHLNDHDAFRKVLPSKLFEYAATGKPIWAGVSGHAAEFIAGEVTNAAVFTPCDADDAVRAFDALEIRDTPRAEFVRRYSRATLSALLAADVLALGRTVK